MTRALSRLIALIILAIIIVAAVVVALLPSDPTNYEISYDSKKGIITATLEEPLPSGAWYCVITYENNTGDDTTIETITNSGIVGITSDRLTVDVYTEPNVLINLKNGTYHLYLKSSSSTIQMDMKVTDHEDTPEESLGKWIAIVFVIVVIALVIVRRIVRGH